jgi:hypothetical protein
LGKDAAMLVVALPPGGERMTVLITEFPFGDRL